MKRLIAGLALLLLSSGASAVQYFNCPSEPDFNANTRGDILFCDDFEDGMWAATNADTSGGKNNAVNDGWSMGIYNTWPDPLGTGYGRCGSKGAVSTDCTGTSHTLSASAPYPNGGQSAAVNGKHWFAPAETEYEEIYIRWYWKQLPGFNVGHEKVIIPQNQTGYQCCVLMKPFGAHTFGFDSFHDVGWMYPNMNGGFTFIDDHWYYLEVRVKLNTPGSANGIYELWADDCGTSGDDCTGGGTQRASYTNRTMRTSAGQKLLVVWFENWGNPGSTGEEYTDQIVVSETFIGPMGASGADVTAPTAPTNLVATAISDTAIDLVWDAATDAVGVTQYRVERCLTSGCSYVEIANVGEELTYNDTGLTASTSYDYQVRAGDAAGNLGSYSVSDTEVTNEAENPYTPGVPASIVIGFQ